MSARPPQLFLFDLHGTTVSDDGQLRIAVERVIAEAQLEAPVRWLAERIAWRKRELFETLLMLNDRAPAEADRLVERFEVHYADTCSERPPRPMPGAQEALDALEYAGVQVGFVSGSPRSAIDRVLDELCWGVFSSLSSDEVQRGRPEPDVVRAAMRQLGVSDARDVGVCGSSSAQLEAGNAAGCRFVIGIPRFEGSDTVIIAPHTHLIESLAELPRIVLGAAR